MGFVVEGGLYLVEGVLFVVEEGIFVFEELRKWAVFEVFGENGWFLWLEK